MKKRLAIWLHGGLGTGHFDQGYPLLEHLMQGLATWFEIVVYSFTTPNPGYSNKVISIRTPARAKRNTSLRWVTVVSLFMRDHRQNKYDIVLAFWGWPAGFIAVSLCKILRLPSAVYLLGGDAAGVPSINYGILHKPLLRKTAMWAYHQCTLLLGISGYQRDKLRSFGLSRSMSVIPWGADPSIYKFRRKEPGEILHFIHVGHLSPVKDQETLIRAFALIAKQRPSELRLFGVDCLNGAMQRLCNTLGIESHVSFMGMTPFTEMPSHYDWADIMLHTSLSEGQSMALTEGATCGILLAGTPVGLLYDLKEDGGIIVDFGDYAGLARRVLEISTRPDEWSRRIQNAKRWADEHTLKWTVTALTRELNDL